MINDRACVLVADDNEVNRKLLTRALEEQGHSSMTVENGKRALELLRAEGMTFDLVLLDILMPEMDGYAALAEIQRDPALRHIPVIMISSFDEMDSVIRCIELGATDFLPKPFNPTLLRARVQASLEKKRLRDQEQKLLHALERELEIGREIQASFLPDQLPQPAGWEIAARFQPARLVAGDFYDAFSLRSGTRVGLVIADVCDKGVGAALFMALFRTLVRAIAEENFSADASGRSLQETIGAVNDYIGNTHAAANMYATLFFAVLDPATGALAYLNAGHNPPAVISNGKIKERLGRTGPAVGVIPKVGFDYLETRLARGETLLAFTDGVGDAISPSGEEFSEARLFALAQAPQATAGRMLDEIQTALNTHIAQAEQFDDITLLAARRI